MPVISIVLAKGQADTARKTEMIREFTQSAVRITGLPAQAFTILFQEIPEENIGLGGKTLPEIKTAQGG